ncbi:arylformamidase [Geminicoccaceae bacterium 1502E]|nr:arylformamidase [Geminicoccaceae bacterium 1502E]
MSGGRLVDISRPLVAGMPVWPGDEEVRTRWTARIAPGCPVNVGAVSLTTHAGTHVDAPLHYDAEGIDVAGLPLDLLVGPCRVVDVASCGPLVTAAALEQGLATPVERLLLRTASAPPGPRFDPSFTAVAADAVELAAARGVRLLGVDTPSVDPADSEDLPAHMAARRTGLLLLEGLDLASVAPGEWELIALPLRLVGMDASPVRAVLRELER